MIKKIGAMGASLILLSGCASINHFFNAEQDQAPVTSIPMQQTYYTVQTGDSLYDIAKRFNVTERTLILWNGLKAPFVLTPGKTIRVSPLPGEKIWRADQSYTYTSQTNVVTHNKSLQPQVTRIQQNATKQANLPPVDASAAPVTSSVKTQEMQSKTTHLNQVNVHDKEVDIHGLTQFDGNTQTEYAIKKSTTGYYIVQSGDSLLEIALANDVSLSDLQTWNDIKESSLIYVGQKIRVRAPNEIKEQISATPKIGEMLNVIHPKPAAQLPDITTSKPLAVANPKSEPIKKPQITSDAQNNIPMGKTVAANVWQWPLKIKGTFDKNGINQQQEINVPLNTKVYAAANGNVLYAGVGMGGYGKMVIISHEDGYISAYNNLSDINVHESQDVTMGEMIGEVGKFNGQTILGFEVRQNGKVRKLGQFYQI